MSETTTVEHQRDEIADLMVVAWNDTHETWSVSARSDGSSDTWTVYEGNTSELDNLLLLGLIIIKGD